MQSLHTIGTPASEPLTRTEVKAWLKIEHTDDDNTIDALITAAREWVTYHTGRCLCSSVTVTESYARWPRNGVFNIGFGPLIAVTHVKYYRDGSLQTVSSSDYHAVSSNGASYVALHENYSAPTIDERPDAIIVTYTAGYATVPQRAKTAMLMAIAYWEGNRAESPQPTATIRSTSALLRALKNDV